jgi:acyl-CoA synthetase (NDP forming)
MNLKQQLDNLFNPGSVAVIGASNTFGKWGFNIFSLLLTQKNREIYAVNKNEDEVLGRKAYQSIVEIPQTVDLAVISVPYKDVPSVMDDCVRKGVKSAIVISGGLAETGEEGAKIERQLFEIAGRGGIRFIGPNCMGNFDTSTDYNTVIFLPPVKKGSVALISQSGNSGQSIITSGLEMGLGFSKYVSSGNEADLRFEDYLEYMAQDDETGIILGYVEGLREGRRFFESAKKITKKKPVVIVKAGRTRDGARAARSHTAALAGSDVIIDTVLRQAGVIRVEDIDQLTDVALLLRGQPLPRGNRIGVLSIGGGMAVMAADALAGQGMVLASLSPATMEKLSSILSQRWSHGNPVDIGGDRFNYSCIWPLIEDDNIDAVLVVVSPGAIHSFLKWFSLHVPSIMDLDQLRKMAEEHELNDLEKVKEMMSRYGKPVIFSSMGVAVVKEGEIYTRMKENHLVPLATPQRAAKALAHVVKYSEYLRMSQ